MSQNDGFSQSEIKTKGYASANTQLARQQFVELFQQAPIPPAELLSNLGLFMRPTDINQMLLMNELYQQALPIHGVIMEFGVRWGRNLALFQALRAIYEPYNYNRKIIGFDSFAGFPSVHAKDGAADIIQVGAYGVSAGYEQYLTQVLAARELESPVSQLRKFELRKGDATQEIQHYLEQHPETIVAFAYFDFDIYEPTKACLQAILPHLTKGSVLGFDELNMADYPGETLAVREVLGLSKYSIRRSRHSLNQSYIIIE